MDLNLKIEYLPVDSLKPYENNAREHGEDDVSAVAESIGGFGFDDPIGIWRDNVIIEGHGRLMAAKRLGMKTVPCIRLDHLSDEQRRAYALAHNRTAELSVWDFDMRDIEIESLDIDMTRFGFDLNIESKVTEIVEDEVPEEAEARCKKGDLWKLGDHRLMCGDATSKEDVERLMSAGEYHTQTADLVLTDPPYGINVVKTNQIGGDKAFGSKGTVGASNIVKANRYSEIIGDDTTETAKQNYEIVRDFTENQVINP